MSNQVRVRLVLFLAAYAGMITLTGLWAQDAAPKNEAAKAESASAATGKEAGTPLPVKPKLLSENVKKALAYLSSQQHANGGWRQRQEFAQMAHNGAQVNETSNTGQSCIASLAAPP